MPTVTSNELVTTLKLISFNVQCDMFEKKIKSVYDTKFFQPDFGPYISLTNNCLL